MAYKLGAKSKKELKGVHPDLVRVVERAIEIVEVDFAVHDGLRTQAEQDRLNRSGASQVTKSKHQRQDDGHGHAVDLVPYINRRLRWEMGPCCLIALAVRQAAEEEGVKIRWGGSWTELTGSSVHPKTMSLHYMHRRMKEGRRPFVDGPHFEIVL